MTQRSRPTGGFSLTYDRAGSGPPVVLLHGWPGDRADYRLLLPRLSGAADLVIPDLRGFGDSDRHPAGPAEAYSAAAQAQSVLALIEELRLDRPLVAGYDVGSRVAQAIARAEPGRIRGLVIGPPVPGVGDRVLSARAQQEFWYQAFHQLELAERLVDGNREACREYLRHFWTHWSGPGYLPGESDLDRLADLYARPGAFTASIAWYRAGAGTVARSLAETTPPPEERIAVETRVLWPEHDPLFPLEWSDRLGDHFARATLAVVRGAGHFLPLEAPDVFARAVSDAIA